MSEPFDRRFPAGPAGLPGKGGGFVRDIRRDIKPAKKDEPLKDKIERQIKESVYYD